MDGLGWTSQDEFNLDLFADSAILLARSYAYSAYKYDAECVLLQTVPHLQKIRMRLAPAMADERKQILHFYPSYFPPFTLFWQNPNGRGRLVQSGDIIFMNYNFCALHHCISSTDGRVCESRSRWHILGLVAPIPPWCYLLHERSNEKKREQDISSPAWSLEWVSRHEQGCYNVPFLVLSWGREIIRNEHGGHCQRFLGVLLSSYCLCLIFQLSPS